jgi:hypothetical protein
MASGLQATALTCAAAFALAAGCGGGVSESEKDRAVAAAEKAYATAKAQGKDLFTGPCIAERLPGLPEWVADVAHDPRQPVDDQATNQCARYRDAEASHFVELDPAGKLIRAD